MTRIVAEVVAIVHIAVNLLLHLVQVCSSHCMMQTH